MSGSPQLFFLEILLLLASPIFIAVAIVLAISYFVKRTRALLVALVISAPPAIVGGAMLLFIVVMWQAAAKNAPAYLATHYSALKKSTSVDGIALPAGSTVFRGPSEAVGDAITLARPAIVAGLPLSGTFTIKDGRISDGAKLSRDARIDGFSCSATQGIALYRGRLIACKLTDVERLDGIPCNEVMFREPVYCRLGSAYHIYGMTFPAGTIWKQRERDDAVVALEKRRPIVFFDGTPADEWLEVHVRPDGLDVRGLIGRYRDCAFYRAHLSQDGSGSVAGRGCKLDVPRGTLTVGPSIVL